MSQRGVSYDEHAGFDRPRRSRPRTKDRPDYSAAPVGMVVTIDRGRFRVLRADDGLDRAVTAAKARQLGRKGVIVGDRVRLDGDREGWASAAALVPLVGAAIAAGARSPAR